MEHSGLENSVEHSGLEDSVEHSGWAGRLVEGVLERN